MPKYHEESQFLLSSPVTVYGNEDYDEKVKQNGESIGSYWHETRQRYTWRLTAITLLVLALLGFSTLNYSAVFDGDSCEYCDDDHTYEFWWHDSYHECLEYDGDTYFTADVCSVYDHGPCYTSSNSCANNSWCDCFCGSNCAEGAGAVCFIETLTVWSLRSMLAFDL